MSLAQTRVCAEVIDASVRGSFVGEGVSEKKSCAEQKNMALLLTKGGLRL